MVDGIERSMDLVDVEDINSFSVLKDATATAVYGVRGANGVILITTRSGAVGAPKVIVRMESGLVAPTQLPKMANAAQFIDLYNEASTYTGGQPRYSQAQIDSYLNGTDKDLYPNVNWVKELYKPLPENSKINANISGGGSIARYYISDLFTTKAAFTHR